MKQQVILATFPNRAVARRAARDLICNNYHEEDVRIAVSAATGEALLTLTTALGYADYAMHILWHQGAIRMDQ